jgi:hypothetical protein
MFPIHGSPVALAKLMANNHVVPALASKVQIRVTS